MFEQYDERVSRLAVLRRFSVAFLCAAFVLTILVMSIYRQDLVHQRRMLEREAQHVLDLQQELLVVELRAVERDLRYLATQSMLREFVSGDPSHRAAVEREYRSFARNKRVYDQIRCLDSAGQEIVRINHQDGQAEVVAQDQLQSKASRYYYQQALKLAPEDVFVSTFDLNVERGEIEQPIKPVIRFLTPVLDDNDERSGFLVLNYLGAQLLSQIRHISGEFSGATMIVNRDGEYLQAPAAEHEWGWLLGHEHRFSEDYPEAWKRGQQPDVDSLRVGQDLFVFRKIRLGRTAATQAADTEDAEDTGDTASTTDNAEANSLILVAYVSADVVTAHSRALLRQLLLLSAGVMAVVALLSYYWARTSALRRRHEERIVESESRLRQLSSKLLAAQEAERRNLSRDLHDELGQQVTAVSLDLKSLAKVEGEYRRSPLLRRAIEEVDQLLRSLHEIAKRVRPRVLDDLGLHDAVESFLAEFSERSGIEVISDLRFHGERIPPAVGENVFRILQEALANVAKHAQVEEAEVIMEVDGALLRMLIEDGGVGFHPEKQSESNRLGILGMRERVELLDGQFEVLSAPGEGTSIHVVIPMYPRGRRDENREET